MGFLRDMREVLKTLKRRKPAKVFCPKCGSPNISFSKSSDIWLLPGKYVCQACGYTGPIVMELEEEKD
jgi:predicted RNA-binding Zn-ribbon protein involved in translation (DUF1610 family)